MKPRRVKFNFAIFNKEETKMETLKDIKQALKDIPDEVLERVFFGIGEGTEETVSLIALETDGDIVGGINIQSYLR